MSQPLLEGRVEADESEGLRRRIIELESDLMHRDADLRKAHGEVESMGRALALLRRQLEPLYTALRVVFGQLDAAGVAPENPCQEPVGREVKASPVWESWISKLGGKSADFIRALLEHGEMTSVQLRVVTHSGQQTVYDVTSKLNKLGLLNKNGGKYSLKQL
jgi:hypothetical protein